MIISTPNGGCADQFKKHEEIEENKTNTVNLPQKNSKLFLFKILSDS